ncbi:hypothetical protein OH809_40155 [Streptomyces sp. NBC_00873]|uniref:hypothetical protein n=1 Tax=unclassified Streptomyces TaxID=2593676 RepID=UPI003868C1F4|nr:hypothetical protein OH809_40155 [Streptomyces sp. NBC_00873]WTA41843.1 hypothetical protein OH821_03545 [Streptomyces sp. NBC_00842]
MPARDIGAVHRTLAALPECRLVAAVTGPANIFGTLWVHDLGDIQRRETALCARLPTLMVTDRIVGLHTAKRMGHLLDEAGAASASSRSRPEAEVHDPQTAQCVGRPGPRLPRLERLHHDAAGLAHPAGPPPSPPGAPDHPLQEFR